VASANSPASSGLYASRLPVVVEGGYILLEMSFNCFVFSRRSVVVPSLLLSLQEKFPPPIGAHGAFGAFGPAINFSIRFAQMP
jgi:hypothetical protein